VTFALTCNVSAKATGAPTFYPFLVVPLLGKFTWGCSLATAPSFCCVSLALSNVVLISAIFLFNDLTILDYFSDWYDFCGFCDFLPNNL